MATPLGGFFATLSLRSDQAAFDKAMKELKAIEDLFVKSGRGIISFAGDITKGLLLVAGAATGAAYAISQIEGKTVVTATKAGFAFDQYNKLSTAMKMVGGDATGMAQKMSSVNDALVDYKMGRKTENFTNLANELALLGNINIDQFKALSPMDRIKLVDSKVQAQKDPDLKRAYRNAADDMLGLGDMELAFTLPGTKYHSFDELMTAAGKKPMLTNGVDATKNSQSVDSLTTSIDGVWKLAGDRMMDSFRPIIDQITDFIDKNQDKISSFFTNIGKILAELANTLEPIVKTLAESLGYVADRTANGPTQAIDLLTASGGDMGSKLKAIEANAPWFGNGSIKASDQQILTTAIDLKARGASVTAGITSREVSAAGLPATVQIGSVTVNATAQDLAIALAQIKSGNVPAINSKEAAVQMAVMAGMLVK